MHAGRWGGLAARGTKGSASAERLNAIPVCLTPELGARRSSTSGSGRRRFQIRNRNREQNRKWKQERNKNKEQLQNFIWDSFDLSKGIDTLTMPYLEKLVMNRWDFIYQHQDDHAVKRALENLNSDYKAKELSLAEQRAKAECSSRKKRVRRPHEPTYLPPPNKYPTQKRQPSSGSPRKPHLSCHKTLVEDSR